MEEMLKPNVVQYRTAMAKLLNDRDLRIFLWSIIEQDCRVFQPDFPMNASAYCLLAKQEIGKRLLADAKALNPTAVMLAEAEYNDLQEQTARYVQEQNNTEGDM
jgi:hypothetical protein